VPIPVAQQDPNLIDCRKSQWVYAVQRLQAAAVAHSPHQQNAHALGFSIPCCGRRFCQESQVLHDALPFRTRIGRTVSSADAHVGDSVDFEILDECQSW
jgi:hypothetical protein